jgi:hypothetical protein
MSPTRGIGQLPTEVSVALPVSGLQLPDRLGLVVQDMRWSGLINHGSTVALGVPNVPLSLGLPTVRRRHLPPGNVPADDTDPVRPWP